MSIGSLVAGNIVSNITMRNIYSYECTQMLMIKTFPGGTGAQGEVTESVFENFWGYSTTYALDINQYWEETYSPDTGAVSLNNLVFNNWTGSLADGMERGPVMWSASDIAPSQNITLEDFYMGGLTGDRMINECNNVYGSGGCIQAATGTATYSTVITTWSVAPAGWTAPASPAWGVSGYGLTVPIPVYTPSVFWPAASASATAAIVTSSVSSSAIPVSPVVSSSQTISTGASTLSATTSVTITSIPSTTTLASEISSSDYSSSVSISESSVSPQVTDVPDYSDDSCTAEYQSEPEQPEHPAFQPESKHSHGHRLHRKHSH
jgi:rhamnogalacturonan hydrolase